MAGNQELSPGCASEFLDHPYGWFKLDGMLRSVRQIIDRKREGARLSGENVETLVAGLLDDTFSSGDQGELLAAIRSGGWNHIEEGALTAALLRVRTRLDLSQVPLPLAGICATGGAGDAKAFLVIASLLAACGVAVPMVGCGRSPECAGICGRLQAVPGFRSKLTCEEAVQLLGSVGMAIGEIRDSGEDAGGLQRLDALSRSESRAPVIWAPLLSRALAFESDGLLFDVKFGAGAAIPRRTPAREVATILTLVAEKLGHPAVAMLSSANQPLGQAVGILVELEEAICCLHGKGPADLEEFCLGLAAELLALCLPEHSSEAARERVRTVLDDRSALGRFRSLLAAQGGDSSVADDPLRLPQARHSESVNYIGSETGWVRGVDPPLVREAARLLALGRHGESGTIDPAVGITELIKVGAKIAVGTPLARLHFNDEAYCPRTHELLRQAVSVSPEPVGSEPVIVECIAADGQPVSRR